MLHSIRNAKFIVKVCWPTMFKLNFFFALQNHAGQCKKVQLTCPNKCGKSIPREAVMLSILF